MANLNIGASLGNVTSLANLPVEKGTVYATLSAPSTISVPSMYQGQKLSIVINPTANMILPMPTTGGYSTSFGDTLALIANVRQCIDIFCIGSGQYFISATQDENAKYAGHDYVDLGLPSGILWATCNVGASKPHEYGKYFQWGATEGYYSGTTEAANHSYWSTCPWSSATPTMTQLDMAHDAARANMGGAWRMPTSADTKELYDYTTNSWTSVSGVNGRRFTSKSNSSNSIFIPAAGLYDSGSFNYAGSIGYVWSSSLTPSTTNSAYDLRFNSSNVYPKYGYSRCYGFSVRGVLG